ncbi:High affinity Ca2+/Mn2+ P-type ATPase-like protein [Entophlyctis luteolus]|nr:High affinity Ca2+/Mn2+ P-type ATPase-like protein [Entophlyctis luteolus]
MFTYSRVPTRDSSAAAAATTGTAGSSSASSIERDLREYGSSGAGELLASSSTSAVPQTADIALRRLNSSSSKNNTSNGCASDTLSITVASGTSSQPSAVFCLKSVQETLAILASSSAGLDSLEVVRRRSVHGQNILDADADSSETLISKFIEQFKNPMNLLLLASAGVSLLIGEIEDAVSITLAMVIVVTVAFVQEYRSEKSLEALNTLLPHYCTVMRFEYFMESSQLISKWRRNSSSQRVLAEELVPGDIVHFSAGDRIPADIRLISCNDAEFDESSLTGETRPRRKHSEVVLPSTSTANNGEPALAERNNIAFMGTLIRSGNCTGIVIGTGRNTEFGGVFTMMKEVETRKTPLQLSMDELGKQLSFASFIVIVIIVLIGVWQGRPILEMFTIGVSLAVAAIPEGLPIVVTVTLALGVLRMASRNAIIKKLPSVESLGSVNVICVDKTGTITMNKMTVTKAFTMRDRQVFEIAASNFAKVSVNEPLRKMIEIAVVCNNSSMTGGRDSVGQPTEIALLDMAKKIVDVDDRLQFTRISEIPFTSERKFMSVTCKHNDTNRVIVFLKGSMEAVLERCNKFFVSHTESRPLDTSQRELVRLQHEEVTGNGLRCVFFAFGSEENTFGEMTFVGFVGMNDPVRPGTSAAVGRLIGSGVRVVMLTGDSGGTASAISREIGIPINKMQSMMSGTELDSVEGMNLDEIIDNINVFYRVTPKHKLSIVRALQSKGYNVAMTGDGVNDAPALRLADIGISMGKSGTDVSKEAADMILVNDDFATILYAIEEGKSIFYNIQNFLRFQLSTSISALSLVAGATLFGFHNPLNAMQILWINIICDGPVAQSLGVETVDPDIMKKPPRSKGQSIITRHLVYRVLLSAFCIVVGTFYVYRSEVASNSSSARITTMTFTCFVLFDMFNSLACRSVSRSIFSLGPLTNQMLNVAVGLCLMGQLLVIYMPFFQRIFQTEALRVTDLVYLLCLTSSVLWIDEARKMLKRRRGGRSDAFFKYFMENKPFRYHLSKILCARSRALYRQVTDLDDFIGASQACIKPVEVKKNPDAKDSVLRIDGKNYFEVSVDGTETQLQTATISLNDCLACSGCITSAESILVASQSHHDVYSALAANAAAPPQERKKIVVTLSPQSRASFAAKYNLTPLSVHKRLVSFFVGILGCDYVVDASFARDFSLIESAREFVRRYRAVASSSNSFASSTMADTLGTATEERNPVERVLPMLASACPGWICYAEKTHDYILGNISTTKSPQQIMGSLIKTFLASRLGVHPPSVYHVSVMPCYDKKLEASRSDFYNDVYRTRDVDTVITTGEVERMLREKGLSILSIPESPIPELFTRAASVNGVEQLTGTEGSSAGGYLSYIFRYAARELFNVQLTPADVENGAISAQVFVNADGSASSEPAWSVILKPGRNLDYSETILRIGGGVGDVLRFAKAYGFRNIQNLVRRTKTSPRGASNHAGGPVRGMRASRLKASMGGVSVKERSLDANAESNHHFVEVMACPSGCINGGGQLKPDMFDDEGNQVESIAPASKEFVMTAEHSYQIVGRTAFVEPEMNAAVVQLYQ